MRQLSIFLNNVPGQLGKITDIIIANDTKIEAMCITDTNENGILRMIVDIPDKLASAFLDNDINCYLSKVVVVRISNPLMLNNVFKLFSESSLNVEYLYTYKEKYYAIKIENIKEAEELLESNDFIVLRENK